MDMAGFAINVNVLWDYHPMVFDTNPRWCCMLETSFLELCCTVEDIEPLADNCTKVRKIQTDHYFSQIRYLF